MKTKMKMAMPSAASMGLPPGGGEPTPAGSRGKDVTPSPGRSSEHGVGAAGCVLLLGREVVLVEQVKDGDRAVRAAQLLPHRFG
jgi:hypothetical protein